MLLRKLIGRPKYIFKLALLSVLLGAPVVSNAAPAIVTGNVNVREGAAARYKKIGTLRPGWQVDAGPCQAGWCHIRVGRIYGWVSARYLNFARVVQPAPHYTRQPTVIIESGPVIRRQPFWGWGGWGNDDGHYRPSRHHYRPPYRPRPLPPQPAPSAPFYDPYKDAGSGPVYPPMRNVPIGQGVRPVGG